MHATKDEAARHGQALALAVQTNHLIHDIDGTISSRKFYGNDPVRRDANGDSA